VIGVMAYIGGLGLLRRVSRRLAVRGCAAVTLLVLGIPFLSFPHDMLGCAPHGLLGALV
jgi:hypothetical protein